MVDCAYLSTDDDEIADIGRQYGAEIIMRTDPLLSDDFTSGGIATQHAFLEIEKQIGVGAIDGLWSGFCTGPLHKPDDTDRLIRAWIKKDAHVMTFKAIPKDLFIYYRLDYEKCLPVVREKATRYMIDLPIGCITKPYQFRKPLILEYNTALYLSTKHSQIKPLDDPKHTEDYVDFPFTNPVPYILGESWQQYEIDQWDEFYVAETMMQRYLINQYGENLYAEYGAGKTDIG